MFRTNPYFDHQELVKGYKYNDDEEVVEIESTEIEWKEISKNPTKSAKKKKKNKGRKTKSEADYLDVESFFNAFKSTKTDDIILAEAKDEADFLREDLIPNSMEYYLDIMGDDEDYVSLAINE